MSVTGFELRVAGLTEAELAVVLPLFYAGRFALSCCRVLYAVRP